MVEWLSQQRSNSAEVRKLSDHAAKVVQKLENPKVLQQEQRNVAVPIRNTSIAKQTCRVKTTIQEITKTHERNIPHSYAVTKIEMLDLRPSISLAPTHQVSKTRDIGLAKLLYGIEKSYDPGKKILDESQKYIPHSYELTKIEMLDLKPSISLEPTPEMDKPLNVGLAKLLYGIEKSYASGKKKLDESQKYSPHSYEVTKIEMLDLKPSISLEPMQIGVTTPSIGLAKLLYGIEKSYASGKKKLDESQNIARIVTRSLK